MQEVAAQLNAWGQMPVILGAWRSLPAIAKECAIDGLKNNAYRRTPLAHLPYAISRVNGIRVRSEWYLYLSRATACGRINQVVAMKGIGDYRKGKSTRLREQSTVKDHVTMNRPMLVCNTNS